MPRWIAKRSSHVLFAFTCAACASATSVPSASTSPTPSAYAGPATALHNELATPATRDRLPGSEFSYFARFDAAWFGPSAPSKIARTHCIAHGGTFVLVLPPARPARDLVEPQSAAWESRAAEADASGGLGTHACTGAQVPFTIRVEPRLFVTGSEGTGLELSILVTEGDAAVAAAQGRQIPAVARAPQTAPAPGPARSRASATPIDRFIAWFEPPTPFGIRLGITTPEELAKRFSVDLAASHCKPPATKTTYCWQSGIDLPGATSLSATFARVAGNVSTLKDMVIHFELSQHTDLVKYGTATWGPPAVLSGETWNWGDQYVLMVELKGQLVVRVDGKDLPAFAAPSPERAEARPFGLELGVQTYEAAVTQLQREGFRPGKCRDLGPYSKTRALFRCELTRPSDPNIEAAYLNYVALTKNVGMVSGFTVGFKTRGRHEREATIADLRQRYGAPTVGDRWQLGAITVQVGRPIGDPGAEWFTVEYSHTRLADIGFGALTESEDAQREQRARGL